MGGSNSNQLIEHVRSFDPRSWSCLHIAEGALSCNNVTVQNNHVGPCGSDAFQEWADGISVSCQNSLVRNNLVENPTVSSPPKFVDDIAWVPAFIPPASRMVASCSSVPRVHSWKRTQSLWKTCACNALSEHISG